MNDLERKAKRLAKWVLWRPPRGIRSGTDSYIYRSRRIDGARFIEIGDRSTVGKFAWLSALERYGNDRYDPRITIGNDVHIGRYCCLTSICSIVIERGCLVSEYVYISDHGHGMDPANGLIVEQPLVSKGPVRIGANTFIGYRACILPGVALGENCIVGAGAVVTRSFPNLSVIVGAPARLIKTNTQSLPEISLSCRSGLS